MPADSKILPFMEGRNGRLLFVQDRVPKSYPWKTWSIKPNVTKHADGVNGEQRDRLSKTLNYYEITAQMYVKDAEWLRDWLAAQAADDAMTAPIDQAGAVRFNPNDGTRKSFILDGLIWDDWDLSQGGRAEKKMVTVNMRCEDIKEGKAL
jgi:hypothetical protein